MNKIKGSEDVSLNIYFTKTISYPLSPTLLEMMEAFILGSCLISPALSTNRLGEFKKLEKVGERLRRIESGLQKFERRLVAGVFLQRQAERTARLNKNRGNEYDARVLGAFVVQGVVGHEDEIVREDEPVLRHHSVRLVPHEDLESGAKADLKESLELAQHLLLLTLVEC